MCERERERVRFDHSRGTLSRGKSVYVKYVIYLGIIHLIHIEFIMKTVVPIASDPGLLYYQVKATVAARRSESSLPQVALSLSLPLSPSVSLARSDQLTHRSHKLPLPLFLLPCSIASSPHKQPGADLRTTR